MPLADIVRFIPISDRLATAGQPTEGQLVELAAAGYEVIINLALHGDPRYSLRDEEASVHALGMEYIHIPVVFATPMASDLVRFRATMLSHASSRILVHCAHNKRVPIFLALHRILDLGWEVEHARTRMLAVWQPDEVWQRFFEDQAGR